MNSEQQENFLRYAEQLGHDRQTLATQGKQVSSAKIGSIDELRALVRPIKQLRAAAPGTVVENRSPGRAPTLEERVKPISTETGTSRPRSVRSVSKIFRQPSTWSQNQIAR